MLIFKPPSFFYHKAKDLTTVGYMCGLNVIFSQGGRIDHAHKLMADALGHRGPDAVGTWSDQHCAFSHTKLSIQDFSDRSNQPLHYENLVIAFNGEIYNARAIANEFGLTDRILFDGDIIGPAYCRLGNDLWHRLDGEFAIAVYDKAHCRLTVARDRVGAKPMYYQRHKGNLYLSSEMKGLRRALPHLLQLNFDRLCFDLVFGPWGPRDETHFEEISVLPPAHYLTATPGSLRVTSYWSPDDNRVESLPDTLAHALETSIRERVTGTLPIAVFLSGGIDSSTVAAIATANSASQVVAYSIRYAGGSGVDEATQAQSTCDSLGIDLKLVKVSACDASLRTWDKIIMALEEPPLDLVYLPVWALYERVAFDGFRVVLTGQGNDELWCGYRNEEALSFNIWKCSPQRVANAFRNKLLRKGVGQIANGEYTFTPLWSGDALSDFLAREKDVIYIADQIRCNASASHSRSATQLAMNSALRRHLDQEDRLGMAHGVESRVPLLSNRLIDIALAHHATGKTDDDVVEKAAFRAGANRFLGPSMVTRAKHSFPAPAADIGREFCTYVLDNWSEIRTSEIVGTLINSSLSSNDAFWLIKNSPQIAIVLASLHRFAQLWLSDTETQPGVGRP